MNYALLTAALILFIVPFVIYAVIIFCICHFGFDVSTVKSLWISITGALIIKLIF